MIDLKAIIEFEVSHSRSAPSAAHVAEEVMDALRKAGIIDHIEAGIEWADATNELGNFNTAMDIERNKLRLRCAEFSLLDTAKKVSR